MIRPWNCFCNYGHILPSQCGTFPKFQGFYLCHSAVGRYVMGYIPGCLFLCNLHDLSLVWTTPTRLYFYFGVHLSLIASDCVAVSNGSTLEIVSKTDGSLKIRFTNGDDGSILFNNRKKRFFQNNFHFFF